jgi:hypothetical protein
VAHLNIEVLDPEPDRFHDAQPAPVEELGDHLGGVMQEREDGGDVFACHDHRDVELLVGLSARTALMRPDRTWMRTRLSRNTRAFMAWF